ncbi:hypothetical protein M9H77_12683 [Catharanthus roseus]|uniref:Uncharacterized protein n=1 Tax=Catharanthus roseus TaxID=4058 RepID=A0ACC0BI11_CATRO|nr:hypothetical protein M9H77_12683 [Catharanthus roseus]
MEDERCEIGPNVAIEGSLENQCSMPNTNTTTTTITTNTTPTHHFSTNSTTTNNNNNNSNNNNDEQDPFQITTSTNTHHLTNSNNNNINNNNEQSCFLSVLNKTHPFSANPNNNNEQDHPFLPISTTSTNNNIQHFSSNSTTKSSSSNNNNSKEQDHRFLPISTNASNSNNSSSNNTSNNNKEQDRFLPIANVGRIMKKFIPGNGKISKDAKETVQECVSEFISFVTGEASDKCQREKRKTINGDDIIWAITTLGFEDYVNPLKQYLNKYRELEGEKLNVPKQQRLQQVVHDHHQKTNIPSYHTVYSSTSLLSQPSFVPTDQPFPLPFSQNSIQTQLPQHEHIDSW